MGQWASLRGSVAAVDGTVARFLRPRDSEGMGLARRRRSSELAGSYELRVGNANNGRHFECWGGGGGGEVRDRWIGASGVGWG